MIERHKCPLAALIAVQAPNQCGIRAKCGIQRFAVEVEGDVSDDEVFVAAGRHQPVRHTDLSKTP
jgi:hypothetical protein